MSDEVGFRFELFPLDLDRFLRFYVEVLRFEVRADRRHQDPPYVYLQRGSARIGALPAWEPVEPDLRSTPQGVELVIEVDDLEAERDAIVASGHSLAEDITERPWGLRDFRIFDSEGYYLRFTTRS